MALREFRDGDGVLWRVWNVTVESLDKRTTAEDYMRDWQDGWLCFESDSKRRRLADFPSGWAALTEAELCSLLARAQDVKRRPSSEAPRFPPDAGTP